MESLHNKIMNIQAKGYPRVMDIETAYKVGHRDARHEAAEMALEYESLIEELVESLDMLYSWYSDEDMSPTRYEEGKIVNLLLRVENDR
jgi:urease accessory protein UreE